MLSGSSLSSSRLHRVKALPSCHQCLWRAQLTAGDRVTLHSTKLGLRKVSFIQLEDFECVSDFSWTCGIGLPGARLAESFQLLLSLIAVPQVNDRFKLDWGTYLTTSKFFRPLLIFVVHDTPKIFFSAAEWTLNDWFQIHLKPRREHYLWADWRQRVWFQGKIFISSSSSSSECWKVDKYYSKLGLVALDALWP